MRRSNNQHRNDETAFLYVRLSRDDGLEGESYSISNQKKLLTKVAKEKGYSKTEIFCDDGISGVTMNRPDFQRMIDMIKRGKGSAVIVKDLSRLGRNYIEVGRLTEEFFPEHRIRFISVSDNLDTEEGESELAPIKNLFNEWYCRDISKKRRLSNKIKGCSGIPLGFPPYGYMKDPDNPNRWIVDPEAALVVSDIFSMAMEGLGPHQISDILAAQKVLTPVAYANYKGIHKPGGNSGKTSESDYHWINCTVSKILARQEYCGDIINFKSYSISYKNKKRYPNDPENMFVFKDVHEPIIDRTTFETIQLRRSETRKRKTSKGEVNMFSGLLVCPDCKSTLNFHFNQGNHEIEYYNCPGYNKGKRKKCISTHYIRVDFLEKIVLAEIRRLTRFACHYEEEFTRVVGEFSKIAHEKQISARESEWKTLRARDKELDKLFERMYEDNLSGKISDERFHKMSSNYEAEQSELKERMNGVSKILEKLKDQIHTTDQFIASVRKYTRAKKLTPRMLHELIDHIEVYHAEKVDGVKKQKVVIHYNCIGSIEIPREVMIPQADISVHTRQGVDISYLPGTVGESSPNASIV